MRYKLTNETNFNNMYDNRIKRYILVPNQYQGFFKRLKVIGNKDSEWNLEDFKVPILKNLRKKLAERDIGLKFIFTVRNPYDIYATMQRYSSLQNRGRSPETLTVNMQKSKVRIHLLNLCEKNIEILKNSDSQNVFIAKHEDMVVNPYSQLAKICDFLQVPISPDYLDDCASIVSKEVHESRNEYDWTENEKHNIASLIKKYDFFSGYDWDT